MTTQICPACHGSGTEIIITRGLPPIPIVRTCPLCNGKGYVEIAK